MKINEIIVRLERWAETLGYSTKQGDLSEIIKDLREEAKVFSSNAVLADSFAFGLYCMNYEHGSTHIDGTKSYRIKGGGVYSKCRTIEELYAEFEKTKANVG